MPDQWRHDSPNGFFLKNDFLPDISHGNKSNQHHLRNFARFFWLNPWCFWAPVRINRAEKKKPKNKNPYFRAARTNCALNLPAISMYIRRKAGNSLFLLHRFVLFKHFISHLNPHVALRGRLEEYLSRRRRRPVVVGGGRLGR